MNGGIHHRIQNPCNEILLEIDPFLPKMILNSTFIVDGQKWYRVSATDSVYEWAATLKKGKEYNITPAGSFSMYLDLIEPVYLMAVLKWQ